MPGRFNAEEIDLADRGGLSGNHACNQFNPAVGASYRIAHAAVLYGGDAESSRASTPAELACAGPADSRSLANFFVGEPDLKQVITKTVEAGLRGRIALDPVTSLHYDLNLLRINTDNDIVFVNSAMLKRVFLTNVDQTRRRGATGHVALSSTRWSVFLNYAYT